MFDGYCIALQSKAVDVEALKSQVLSQAKHDLITHGNEEIYEIVRLLTVNCIDHLHTQGYLTCTQNAENVTRSENVYKKSEKCDTLEAHCGCGDTFTKDALCVNCLAAQSCKEKLDGSDTIAAREQYLLNEIARLEKERDEQMNLALAVKRNDVPKGYALVPSELTAKNGMKKH